MATYQFSALADGQSISFSPSADVLNFDQSVIAAADIRVTTSGTSTRIEVISGTHAGKDITLLNTAPAQLALSNVTFANGSRLLIGDTTTSTASDDSGNVLTGTAGRDYLNGWGGVDTMNGGAGDDAYYVTSGDIISDSGGIDTVYSQVSFSLSASSGVENLTMTGTAVTALNGNQLNNVLTGSEGSNSSINGRAGNDTMYGLGGNDTFDMSTGGTASYGNDFIDGGSGVDVIDWGANGRSAVVADLTAGTASGGGDGGLGTITIVNIENLVGTAFNDRLTGNTAANFLYGGAGDDTLSGGAGNDRLEGATGLDHYVFSVAPSAGNADTVVGFAPASDSIVLDGSAHAGSGAAGQFTSTDARFLSGAGVNSAQDSTDRVVYNTTTGQLWYDADGAGGAAAQLIATLQGAPALTATDIHVVNAGGSGGGPVTGTAGNDSLTGTNGNDTIDGLGGNDTISGVQGNDVLTGGDGNDSLRGGPGSDSILGGAGNDTLQTDGWDDGSPSDGDVDTLAGGLGDDFYELDRNVGITTVDQVTISDSGGVDTVLAHSGSFALGAGIENLTMGHAWTSEGNTQGVGNELNNLILGYAGWWVDNHLQGLGGNDTLAGGDGGDRLEGGVGNDRLEGGEGADSLVGGDGNDVLHAGFDEDFFEGPIGDGSADTLDGGLGDDQYHVTGDGDVILADPGGLDHVSLYNGGAWTLAAGLENLTLHSNFGFGNSYDVTGNELDNTITALFGAGLVIARGMGGNDLITADEAGEFEAYGGEGNDTLQARQGEVRLFGEAGNDVFMSVEAAASFTGGAGADSFVIQDLFFGTRNITDFTSSTDKIRLDANAMPALGTGGNFAVNDERFHSAPGATAGAESDDRVIYNTTTGELFYDPDGSGSGAATRIATLQAGATLVATDIAVDNGAPPSQTNGTAGNDSLTGTSGNDTIDGLAGDDTIEGNEGSDSLIGGAGNDKLFPGLLSDGSDHAFDTLDGGLGNDEYYVWNIEDTILSDPGGIDTVYATGDWTLGGGLDNLEMSSGTGTGNELDNRLVSPADSGTLFGMGGNDVLVLVNAFNSSSAHGGDGNDTLEGGRNSTLFGDAGNDLLIVRYPAGITTMTGGAGADHFSFESGFTNTISDFTSSSDKIRLDAQVMTALGTNGNFTAGDERFHAGTTAAEADDRVIWNAATGELWYDADGSGSGQAMLIATLQAGANVVATDIIVDNGTPPPSGGQTITGTAGNDSLTGTNGNDTLDGLGGTDTLNGGLGDDKYIAQAGDVIVDSGGVDTLETPSAWNLASSPIDHVTLTGTAAVGIQANGLDNRLIGNSANNSLEGRAGNDTISGMAGNDYLRMSTTGGTSFGNDVLDGGDGTDTVDYDAAQSALNADLTAGTLSGGEAGGGGGATLTSIEGFEGGAFNDRISGSAANNQLIGNAGNDTLIGLAGGDSLSGGDGNDWVEGGSGYDTLVGGAGNDSFVFTSTSGRITDFATGVDQLVFENAVFAGLGAPADWAAGDGRFRAAAGATTAADADDRLIYNTTNGNLYYDSDGVGGAGAQLVTTIANLPALSAADISVI